MIIPYPSFVVSIPHCYSAQFQEHYQKLKKDAGCIDIAIRLRKNTPLFYQYTICSRGTLESCQKLEEMLTPTLEYDEAGNLNFAEMKEVKSNAMKELLENVFGFIPPPMNELQHARTTAGRMGDTRRQRHISSDPFGLDGATDARHNSF
uniref:DUF7636 domain-containing protein n=1 Tax=Panagrolaimus superbus TaxID=310955 RepID=A0A914YVU7_9BILA